MKGCTSMDEPTPNASPRTELAITNGLSERLLRLSELTDLDAMTAQLFEAPGLLAEARVALPTFAAMARRPAGEEGLKSIVKRRFQIYPQPVRADFEWAEFWRDYNTACATISPEALEAAMKRWVKLPTSQFLPKPGELRTMALAEPTEASGRYNRLQQAVRDASALEVRRNRGDFKLEAPELKRIFKPPEDRELVRGMQGAFVADHARREAERLRDRPPGHFHLSQGKPGPSGLTAVMRKHMGLPEEFEVEGQEAPRFEDEPGDDYEPEAFP